VSYDTHGQQLLSCCSLLCPSDKIRDLNPCNHNNLDSRHNEEENAREWMSAGQWHFGILHATLSMSQHYSTPDVTDIGSSSNVTEKENDYVPFSNCFFLYWLRQWF
jgi:hypothetical protein